MEIIAKTNKGVIITASESEIKEVLNSVTGTAPDKLEIGQKIPAIDYARTLEEVKTLGVDSKFKYMKSEINSFYRKFEKLVEIVDSAQDIKI